VVNNPEKVNSLLYAGPSVPLKYRNAIFAKIKRGLRRGNSYYKLIDQETFNRAYDAVIEMWLSRPAVLIRFVVVPEPSLEDVIIGFSIFEGATLHFVWVDPNLRREGLGRALVPAGITAVSHLTTTGLGFWNAVIPGAIFNPFIS